MQKPRRARSIHGASLLIRLCNVVLYSTTFINNRVLKELSICQNKLPKNNRANNNEQRFVRPYINVHLYSITLLNKCLRKNSKFSMTHTASRPEGQQGEQFCTEFYKRLSISVCVQQPFLSNILEQRTNFQRVFEDRGLSG